MLNKSLRLSNSEFLTEYPRTGSGTLGDDTFGNFGTPSASPTILEMSRIQCGYSVKILLLLGSRTAEPAWCNAFVHIDALRLNTHKFASTA